MKLPSWTKFIEGASKFEQQVKVEKTRLINKIQASKDAHPVLDEIINRALPFLPSPFNGLAQAIYNSFQGTKKEEAIETIIKFLESFKSQGEDHYNIIANKLDTIRSDMAQQGTLLLIKDILINENSPINQKLNQISGILNEILDRQSPTLKEPALIIDPKPKTFHGENPIFIGRQNYLDKIKAYLTSSNDPICLTGMGGIGKSALAFKAIHQSEGIFDLVIPVYFAELGANLDSFLFTIAKSLNVPKGQFVKMELLDDRKQFLIDTLGSSNTHPLIFADNYETVTRELKNNAQPNQMKYNDAVQINSFLKRVPHNTSIILTSQLRKNLDREREVQVDTLSIEDGTQLFINLVGADLENPSEKMQKAIEKLIQKIGMHPLSIEILAKSYQGSGIDEIEGMLNSLGIGLANLEQEQERLRTLEASFEYSISSLGENLQQLLPKLLLFRSPFPSSAVSEIFDVTKVDIISLHNRSLVVRIDTNENDKERIYSLYSFHPAIRNYLEYKTKATYSEIEKKYGQEFSEYYCKLLKETYNSLEQKESGTLYIKRFNIIRESETNDFSRAIDLTKDTQLRSEISSYMGLILHRLGLLIFGRDSEIKLLYDELASKKSVVLVTGEAGIGKSALLETFYRKLKYEDQGMYLVGFYDKTKALVGESRSLMYPFTVALTNLIQNTKQSQKSQETTKATNQEAANQFFLEDTKVTKLLWDKVKGQETSSTVAKDFVEILQSYLDIFKSIAEEFKERQFVLIFDQFENEGKASIDFLINFAKLMPDRFHIIVSFRLEATTTRHLYEWIKNNLINLGYGKELELKGLSAEAIGKWLGLVRKVGTKSKLPLIPDLQRIKENSAGFPILLKEWIEADSSGNYGQINRKNLCEFIIKRTRDLEMGEINMLNRMAVLVQPPIDEKNNQNFEALSKFLNIELGYMLLFIDRLVMNGLFEQKNDGITWFKHELIQKCIEDHMTEDTTKMYHKQAALWYLTFYEDSENANRNPGYNLLIACAYHLYKAGMHEESYNHNKNLAQFAFKMGDIDLAERSYERAIKDAEHLGKINDKMKCTYELTKSVYFYQGRYAEAFDNYQELSKYFSRFNDIRYLAMISNDVALIRSAMGN